MDLHQGRNGVAWSPEIIVGGKTTSKNMVHSFTLNKGCYPHFIGFFQRITMTSTGAAVTKTHERYFTDHVIHNSVPHFIGDIVTVNFEFSSLSTANNRYNVVGVLFDHATQRVVGQVLMMHEDLQNTVLASTIIVKAGYDVLPEQRTSYLCAVGSSLV